jgi:hypothetical protein
MNFSKLAAFAALSTSLASASAFAAQDPAFGVDPFHQFGYERSFAAGTSEGITPKRIGYEVYYVYGSDARMPKEQMMLMLQQLRDILGEQPGA